jgi:hypothetical protein
MLEMASTLKAVALSLFFPLIANAQTPLPPTYEALTNAAATGGDFRFSAAGTIIIPTPVSFASATILDADGHAVILSGEGKSSMLQLETNVTLTLRGVALVDGLARGTEEAGAVKAGQGGAILNLGGNLTLMNCVVSNNLASGATNKIGPVFGGTGPQPVERPAADAAGGAIWQIGGRLRIENCAFSVNRTGSSVESYAPAEGGAIYIKSAEGLEISGTTFFNNSAVTGGASLPSDLNSLSKGGAIYVEATPARIDGGEISGNRSVGTSGFSFGGGIYQAGSSLTVSNLIVSHNGGFGGFIPGRLMQRGFDAAGGAIFSDGELSVESSAFLSNICVAGEAANGAGPTFAYGGAISSGGNIRIMNTTMAGNQSYSTYRDSFGVQTNVTEGGALYCGGTAGITNSTIVAHLKSLSPLGAGSTNTITVKNTLFADNRYEPQRNLVVDAGHNLSSNSEPPFTESTSANGVNPKLGPLGLYGGSTPVYALAAGSPAIDSADDSAAPAKDQRGRMRPFGAHADIGAFESSPPFFVWGKIRGYVDPATTITIGATTNRIDSHGSFFIGPLEPGVHIATLSATDAVLRPNPWLIASDADRELSEVKSYKRHAITFDHELNDPAFVLAGDPGEVWDVELSPDFTSWTERGPFTIPDTGLTNVPTLENAPFMFMRGSYTAPAP